MNTDYIDIRDWDDKEKLAYINKHPFKCNKCFELKPTPIFKITNGSVRYFCVTCYDILINKKAWNIFH